MLNQLGLSRRDVIRYAVLPGVVPRLHKLFGTGFGSLSYLIVVAFNALGIIPNGHPYLRVDHMGRYSVISALSAAASHIKFDRKNIDKVSVFVVILSGLVMMALQIILGIMALFAAPAYAANSPTTFSHFFGNANTNDDIAFRIMDMIFGIPGIFNSKDMVTTPFHTGLHALFEFYSYGILLVGTFVIVYYVARVVLETAKSGVPFGERFNKAWTPIRLVLFFGLLLPTTNGINLAQYILLNAAKLGSNLATNAWITFDEAVNNPYLGSPSQLVAHPITPDLESLASFMALSRVCSWAEGRINGYDIRPYIVYGPGQANSYNIETSTPAFSDVVSKVKGGTIFVRFGVQDENLYPREQGAVYPYCGELALTLVDQAQPGAALMQQAYLESIGCLWNGTSGAAISCSQPSFSDHGRAYTKRYSMVLPYDPYPDMTQFESDIQKTQVLIQLNHDFDEALTAAVDKQISEGKWINTPALQLGWGGAAIWFNKIAEQNGALSAAAMAKPIINKMPDVMEYIKQQKLREDKTLSLLTMYTPVLASGRSIAFETPQQRDVALVLNNVYRYWGSDTASTFFPDVAETHRQSMSGNIIIDVMNTFMGTRGLFDMCKNTDVHPLAQLASVGSAMIEHSIRTFAMAAGVGATAGILSLLDQQAFSQTLMPATSFFITFASIGLIIGFVMYYVLPFLPFIYFFFAVMTWCKGCFEAMVGMPLWALAHLRIDGEGMPGQAAAHGYFYILEIFLRPICILIGFLGGIVIFTAMVKVLNVIFYLVISNLTGHDVGVSSIGCFNPPGTPSGAGVTENMFKRGIIDEFFYTVIYTIVVYMIAIPCFKLVDLIPDHISTWLGSGISPFGTTDGDPAEGMMTYVTAGAGLVGKQLQSTGKSMGLKS